MSDLRWISLILKLRVPNSFNEKSEHGLKQSLISKFRWSVGYPSVAQHPEAPH